MNVSQELSEPVHHVGFMFHKRVSIAVEGNGRVFMSEDLGERLHIHAALEGAGGERVPQGVKALMRYF